MARPEPVMVCKPKIGPGGPLPVLVHAITGYGRAITGSGRAITGSGVPQIGYNNYNIPRSALAKGVGGGPHFQVDQGLLLEITRD